METNSHDLFISFSFKDQPLAENIVNKLMNTYHISCWICTYDIRAGENYKKMIVKAITDAKLVLMIQSESSMLSTEVPKEIAIALKKNKTVIPFVIDNSELSEDLEYDLLTVQRIDARRPTLDERIEELAQQICAALGRPFEKDAPAISENASKRRLVPTASVLPKKVFCGREDTLAEIDRAFKGGERVIFLYGIGGIGKTQIAKQYAKRHTDDYDTVIYATYDRSIRDMLLSDSAFLLDPPFEKYTMDDGSKEDADAYLVRKLAEIHRITDERTLIILDNFDIEEDDSLPLLTNGNYRLLVTSRCDYSRYYHTVKIDPIDSVEQLKDIFMQNYCGYEVERDDPLLAEIIELVNRHTYTIELIAQHMENSGQTTREMLDALKKEGITSLSEEVRNAEMKTSVAYENLLRMFKIFSLTNSERQILTYLSLMPITGVNTRNFREWADLSSAKTVKSLETRSWITRNTDGIALHPIVREVVKHEIPASEEECLGFVDRFTDAIIDKKTWSFKMDEKERYLAAAKSIMEQFCEINSTTEDFYYYAQTLASFAYDTDTAIDLGKRLYDYHKEHSGEVSFKTARAAFKMGWIYVNGRQSTAALIEGDKWLTLADTAFEQIELDGTDEISRHTMNKRTLSALNLELYRTTGEDKFFEKAQEYALSSLRHAEANFKPGDFHYVKIGGSRAHLVRLYVEKQRYDEALREINKVIEMFESVLGENDIDTIDAYYYKGIVLCGLRRFEEAEEYLLKSAKGFPEYMGKYHHKTHKMNLKLAECLSALGKHSEASEALELALDVAERIFAPGSAAASNTAELLEKEKGLITATV